jgi:hypothetical protein
VSRQIGSVLKNVSTAALSLQLPLAAHRRLHAVFPMDFLVGMQTVSAALVAVENAALGRRAKGDS